MSLVRTCLCDVCGGMGDVGSDGSFVRPLGWAQVTVDVRFERGMPQPSRKLDMCPSCLEHFGEWTGGQVGMLDEEDSTDVPVVRTGKPDIKHTS